MGLKSGSAIDRLRAASMLSRANPGPDTPRRPEVAAALAAMVRDPMIGHRAMPALASWATADQAPILIDLLASPDVRTRHAAIEVLGRLGGPGAVRPLAERLAESFDRDDAIRALQAIGPDSEPEMVRCLSHRDDAVRRAACQVLDSIGSGRSLAPLQATATSDRNRRVQQAAARAYQSISHRLPGPRPGSRMR